MSDKSGWTDERVQLLTSYWAAGCSAAVISEKFGDISRSAVAGKVSRMGLPKRETLQSHRQLPPPVSEIDFIGIPFAATTDSSCMYPEGDGGSMLFCGNPRQDESSYCSAHHSICWVKPNKPKPSVWRRAA